MNYIDNNINNYGIFFYDLYEDEYTLVIDNKDDIRHIPINKEFYEFLKKSHDIHVRHHFKKNEIMIKVEPIFNCLNNSNIKRPFNISEDILSEY